MFIRTIDSTDLKSPLSELSPADGSNPKAFEQQLRKKLLLMSEHFGLSGYIQKKNSSSGASISKTNKLSYFSILKSPLNQEPTSDYFFLYETLPWVTALVKPLMNKKTNWLTQTGNVKSTFNLSDFVGYYSDLLNSVEMGSNKIGYNRLHYSQSYFDTTLFVGAYRYFTETLFPKVLESLSEMPTNMDASKALILINHLLEEIIINPKSVLSPDFLESSINHSAQLINLALPDDSDQTGNSPYDFKLYSDEHLPLDTLIAHHIFNQHTQLFLDNIDADATSDTDTFSGINEQSGINLTARYLELTRDYKLIKRNPIEYIKQFEKRFRQITLGQTFSGNPLHKKFSAVEFINANKSTIDAITNNHDDILSIKDILLKLDQCLYPLVDPAVQSDFDDMLKKLTTTSMPFYIYKQIIKRYTDDESDTIAESYKQIELDNIDAQIKKLTDQRDELRAQSPDSLMSQMKNKIIDIDKSSDIGSSKIELSKKILEEFITIPKKNDASTD